MKKINLILLSSILLKKAGKGLGNSQLKISISFHYYYFILGFSIIGRRQGHGTFISHIVRRFLLK